MKNRLIYNLKQPMLQHILNSLCSYRTTLNHKPRQLETQKIARLTEKTHEDETPLECIRYTFPFGTVDCNDILFLTILNFSRRCRWLKSLTIPIHYGEPEDLFWSLGVLWYLIMTCYLVLCMQVVLGVCERLCFLFIIDHQTTFLKDRIKTNNGF